MTKNLPWFVMTFFSVSVALYGWVFLLSEGFGQSGQMAMHFADRPLAAMLHFGFSPLALLIGGFQFLASVRKNRPAIHRWIGRTYVVACMLGAVGGLWMALTTEAGPMAQSGFALLGIAWIFTTGKAYLEARAKRFDFHRRWMIRSFALTFAAVTLRIYLSLTLGAFQMDFSVVYPVIAWACWVPNLLFAEFYVRRWA